jgi:hypothetical protein
VVVLTFSPGQEENMAENGIAYRLGWALYWFCLMLGALWVGFAYWYFSDSDAPDRVWGTLTTGGSGAIFAYGLGRFFRYVLSEGGGKRVFRVWSGE